MLDPKAVLSILAALGTSSAASYGCYSIFGNGQGGVGSGANARTSSEKTLNPIAQKEKEPNAEASPGAPKDAQLSEDGQQPKDTPAAVTNPTPGETVTTDPGSPQTTDSSSEGATDLGKSDSTSETDDSQQADTQTPHPVPGTESTIQNTTPSGDDSSQDSPQARDASAPKGDS